ncbi:fibronectin type III domain-containing protein [Pelagicoccus enzymogenes]|uniref:fibronectin type III domain-containing protein n=1 Tax=Pelagicoccus enzymogenes TaxID=2773457 RepID=UPI002810577F|nr:fibronectin type III domain-containing protein [Pelagicoccus enzymogenes]MDQ8197548.1 fibronectin type III domain-containing protein [Pelagicoccus enzymogenes]
MCNVTKFGIGLGALALASVGHASISFNIAAGTLRDGSGVAINNGLVILVASTDGPGSSFALPTPTQFVQGDDVIVAKWNFSEGGGLDGEFLASKVIANYGSDGWDEGDPLALFWYPTLNKDSVAPGDAKFGVFANPYPDNNTTSDPWVIPPDNTHLYSLQFFAEGSVLNQTSFASQYVAQASLDDESSLELSDVMTDPSKASPTSNTISWDLSAGAVSYTVQRRKVGGSVWETVGSVSGATNSFLDDTLSAGMVYEYQVIAENGLNALASLSSTQLQSERSLLTAAAARSYVTPEVERSMYAAWDISRSLDLGNVADPSKKLIIQGTGPFYSKFGIPRVEDPDLTIYRHNDPTDFFAGNVEYASNDNWMDAGSPATEIADVQMDLEISRQINNFEVNSKDSSYLGDFLPGYTYSAIAASNDGTTGSSHIGVYSAEYDGGTPESVNRITSLSTRGYLGEGDANKMFGYFKIEGNVAKDVVIRVEGPGLVRVGLGSESVNGVPGGSDLNTVLPDPRVVLNYHPDESNFFSNVVEIARNDNWQSQAESDLNPSGYENVVTAYTNPSDLVAIQARLTAERDQYVEAFEDGALDSLLYLRLQPGHYTFSVLGDTGIAVLKVFEIEEQVL